MSKHTPGPWVVYTRKDDSGDMPYFEYRIWAYPYGEEAGPLGVASVDRKNDAQFIAAAPDLVDVAHMVLTTATVYTPPELVKAATEALRKAGEI